MATTDTQLSQLVINVGSKSQIEAAIQGGTITTDMLSFTTDGDDYLTSEDVTSTYSATGTDPVNGTAVASAISDLNIPTVDQAYSATSTNAQSGTAVASAISDKVSKTGGSSTQTVSLTSGTGTTAFGVKSMSTSSYLSFSNSTGWIGSIGVLNTKLPTFYNGTSHTFAFTEDIPTVTSTYSATGTDAVNGTAVASAISGKQDTLVSGTSIKTINSTSLLGSGNIAIDGLPSQTGQSGKFLTTNGSSASWATVSTGSTTLSDLTDTNISNPSNGQTLVYDSSTGKWVNQAQSSGGINYAGSVAYASLPTPAAGNVGNVYNVTDAFTTDSRFVDGASKTYPAGTDVLVVEDTGTVATAYYGWRDDRHNANRWTTSETPAVGDKTYYILNGVVTESDVITSVSSDSISAGYFYGERYSSLDTTISTTSTGYFFDVFMGDMTGYQTTSNLVTSVSSASTDTQYPSAKLFYDTCGDIESLINAL